MNTSALMLAGWLAASSAAETQELIPAKVKEAARQALKDESSPPTLPSLEVTETEVALKLGGLERPSAKRTPLAYALEEQVVIELFRDHPPKAQLPVNWAPVLKAAQVVVDRQVAVAQDKTLTPAARETALKQDREKFEDLFENALKPLAGKREVVIVQFKGPGRFTVKVRTAPPNGTVFYLPALQYKLLKASGGLDDDQNWLPRRAGTRRHGDQGKGVVEEDPTRHLGRAPGLGRPGDGVRLCLVTRRPRPRGAALHATCG